MHFNRFVAYVAGMIFVLALLFIVFAGGSAGAVERDDPAGAGASGGS